MRRRDDVGTSSRRTDPRDKPVPEPRGFHQRVCFFDAIEAPRLRRSKEKAELV